MTTRLWLRYFQRNKVDPFILPTEDVRLTPKQFSDLSGSLPCFQLGEGSDGKRLIAAADEFARQRANPAFGECIRYFTAEEAQHSQFLASFMKVHGIPFATTKCTDSIFRFIRGLAGIELSMRVLVCAELVALSYYRALAKVTSSKLLTAICEKMVRDEHKHLAFEMHHIHWINLQKPPLFQSLTDAAHSVLILGTIVVAWIEHRNVLKAEFGFRSFFRDVWGNFRHFMADGSKSAFVDLHGYTANVGRNCYE